MRQQRQTRYSSSIWRTALEPPTRYGPTAYSKSPMARLPRTTEAQARRCPAHDAGHFPRYGRLLPDAVPHAGEHQRARRAANPPSFPSAASPGASLRRTFIRRRSTTRRSSASSPSRRLTSSRSSTPMRTSRRNRPQTSHYTLCEHQAVRSTRPPTRRSSASPLGAASPSSIEMQIHAPLWRIAPCSPTEGRKEIIGSRMPRGPPIHRHPGRTNLEIHRLNIGGNAGPISPVFTAAPQKDAAVSSGLCPRLHLGRRNQPGTGLPAPTQQVQGGYAFAQARKQLNLLDSP